MSADRAMDYPFHGEKRKRRVTDIPCLLIFIGWAVFAAVTLAESFSQGNIDMYAPHRAAPSRRPMLRFSIIS